MRGKNIIKREITRQAAVFLLIGGLATILNYSVFYLLYRAGILYIYSSIFGYLTGLILGYFLNKVYTFKSKESFRRAIPLYLAVYIFSLLLIIIFLPIMVEYLSINALIANFILLIVTTFINFFGSKILAFRNKDW